MEHFSVVVTSCLRRQIPFPCLWSWWQTGGIEMAWIMGYIKHFDGRLKDGALYIGWVDSKTAEPVDDKDVKGRYQKDVLQHAGVRLIGMFGFTSCAHLT